MAGVKIPYTIKIGDRLFWQPNGKMRAGGAKAVACGQDGPEARRRALDAYEAWKGRRASSGRPKAAPARGTLAAAFEEFRKTPEWNSKEPRTREEWDRCWRRIAPAFGGCKPSSVTLAQISRFRQILEQEVSLREAHRCVKIWRALWQVAAALKYCQRDDDPSFGVRNIEPQPRKSSWAHGEVVRLAKGAWRSGYKGLAVAIAVAWDTSLSPVDVRSLRPIDREGDAFNVERAKTGQSAIGTISRRSVWALDAYLADFGADVAPTAPIFRNRSGRAYSKDTLGDDFRDVRAIVFGANEKRTLADFRRSGTIEAIRGGAADGQIAAKMANRFDKSSSLRKTYSPVDLASVRAADEARKRGRK
jgi:hypothetical protein